MEFSFVWAGVKARLFDREDTEPEGLPIKVWKGGELLAALLAKIWHAAYCLITLPYLITQ